MSKINEPQNEENNQKDLGKVEKFKNRRNFVYRPDSALLWHDSYYSTENGKKCSQLLNEKKFRMNSNEITYRVLNHWEKNDLLTTDRPSGKGWRKYSMFDLIWTKIINRLRKMGYPIEKIKLVKEDLEIDSDNKHTFFELYIAGAFLQKKPVYLLVFENGEADVVTHSEYVMTLPLQTVDDHIVININKILAETFPRTDFRPEFEPHLSLLPEEMELMAMIRLGNYESIEVKLNDGRIERFDSTENILTDKKLSNILKEHKYQKIEIIQQNGKVQCIKRTVKKKG